MKIIFLIASIFYAPTLLASDLKVAAAASLNFALTEIAAQFQQQTNHLVKISFGSSGNLTRQIEQGAPFEIFFSADKSYTKRLVEKKLTRDEGDNDQTYAKGQLAIFYPSTNSNQPTADLSVLKKLLQEGSIEHFSIPNPDLAPYGRIAKQALQNAQIWNQISKHLIIGENASQSAMFASTGAVDGALLPLPLAMILQKKNFGSYQLLEPSLYQILNQHAVLLSNASPAAIEFYNYILSPTAQQILSKHGFAPAVN